MSAAGLLRRAGEIAERLRELARFDTRNVVFGADGHGYRLQPPLTEAEAAELEARAGCTFPDAYRLWITQIADGGAGPGYGLLSLRRQRDGGDWPPREMAKPFSREAGASGGTMLLSHFGCGQFAMLVVTGEHRGQVCSGGDGEAYELHGVFFDWMEEWLSEGNAHAVERYRALSERAATAEARMARGEVDVGTLDDLAIAAGLRGDLETSTALYNRAGTLVESEVSAGALRALWRGWSHCLHTLKRYPEALAVVDRAIAWAEANDEESLAYQMGQRRNELLLRVGRYEEGLQGLLREHCGDEDADEGEDQDEEANQWDAAERASVYRTVVWHCLQREEFDKGMRFLAQAGDDAQTHNMIGIMRKERGDLAGAEQAYRESIARERNAPALDNLANVVARQGKVDEAIAMLEEARSLNPDDTHVLACLGAQLWCAGRRDEAVTQARRAIAGGADRKAVEGAFDEAPRRCDDLLELLFPAT